MYVNAGLEVSYFFIIYRIFFVKGFISLTWDISVVKDLLRKTWMCYMFTNTIWVVFFNCCQLFFFNWWSLVQCCYGNTNLSHVFFPDLSTYVPYTEVPEPGHLRAMSLFISPSLLFLFKPVCYCPYIIILFILYAHAFILPYGLFPFFHTIWKLLEFKLTKTIWPSIPKSTSRTAMVT